MILHILFASFLTANVHNPSKHYREANFKLKYKKETFMATVDDMIDCGISSPPPAGLYVYCNNVHV